MITANAQQLLTKNSALDWYFNSSEQIFQIDGEAGTGKSWLLNWIIGELGVDVDRILCMAYTGQAAIVMRTKGLVNAITCHSGLFEWQQEVVRDKVTGEPIIDKQFHIPVVKDVFVPKPIEMFQDIDLIVIDEAWMVPRKFRPQIDRLGIKTIVCGDSGQLPPVKDDPGYLVDGHIHHLNELMRQAESSPIVYIARQARQGIDIMPGLYGNRVLVMYDNELNMDLISKANVVITGKNSTREYINNRFRREVLYTDSTTPIFGERMICKKNNHKNVVDGIPLVNGLIGTVVKPPSAATFNRQRSTYQMNFHPDLLSRPFTDLNCDYRYLNASHEEKMMLKNSPYAPGEKFDWAYASTTHSAQGSEYQQGIYIEEFLNAQIQTNINYTAITRFKDAMIYVKRARQYY